MKKSLRIILVGFFVFTFIGQVILWMYFDSLYSSSNQGMSIRGADVVFFMADGYSENDFLGVKEYLSQWRGTVIVAGVSENLTSTEGSISSDILISDIENISTYDAVVIPGGLSAPTLNTDQNIISLLNEAKEQGLVIAGIGNGTLVQAKTGLISGKKFTTHSSIVANLTAAGGVYIDGATVVTDETIITASPPNYEEFSYAIANAMGYSYTLAVDISFEKEEQGWNYSITIEVSDKKIVNQMTINLSISNNGNEKTFLETLVLHKEAQGTFNGNFGILANDYYTVDIRTESIYGTIEIRPDVTDFSVGSN
ncbi:MAG: DJ-1/PfpI family protein [Candidatus Hodarchaeales archaeon]|jgi:protease I